MHDLRLIHTDLKPENILLVSSDYVKVPDYKVFWFSFCLAGPSYPLSLALKHDTERVFAMSILIELFHLLDLFQLLCYWSKFTWATVVLCAELISISKRQFLL